MSYPCIPGNNHRSSILPLSAPCDSNQDFRESYINKYIKSMVAKLNKSDEQTNIDIPLSDYTWNITENYLKIKNIFFDFWNIMLSLKSIVQFLHPESTKKIYSLQTCGTTLFFKKLCFRKWRYLIFDSRASLNVPRHLFFSSIHLPIKSNRRIVLKI